MKRGDFGTSGKLLVNMNFIIEVAVIVMDIFKLNSDCFL